MIVDAQQVTVVFKTGFMQPAIRALDAVNINVERGDVFGLLGPNGAGKSTAMYCFLGLIRPNAGSVTLFEHAPKLGSAVFDRIAYVPEEPHYPLYLTVEEAVDYYASLYRRPIPKTRVADAIKRVGLSEFARLRLDRCSKGMKQKVGLATCLLNEPELVFLDEPTRGLDPVMVKEFRDIVLEMNQRGITFVINSHILSEIELVCNRVAVMAKGNVLVQDALRNILRVDLDNYAVTLEAAENLPAFVTVLSRTAHEVKALVPNAQVADLFAFAKDRSLKIYECALKRVTLEEAFMEILSRRPEYVQTTPRLS